MRSRKRFVWTVCLLTAAVSVGCASRRTTQTGGSAPPPTVSDRSETDNRLKTAVTAFQEIMNVSDKAIPDDLLKRAHCVVIIPGMKSAALGVGGKYGKGFLTCRQPQGNGWTAPGSIIVEGGSFGLQIGASETDVVMLVMNQRGEDRLLSSQFTLGGEATVAAGPVGRSGTAQTDAYMTAEILSYSRSRGVFAGISLTGSTLREDIQDNRALYGQPYTNRDIIQGKVQPPAAAQPLLTTLGRYSPEEAPKANPKL